MEKDNEDKKVTCIYDEEEDLDTKITKIFESYLERVFNGILN